MLFVKGISKQRPVLREKLLASPNPNDEPLIWLRLKKWYPNGTLDGAKNEHLRFALALDFFAHPPNKNGRTLNCSDAAPNLLSGPRLTQLHLGLATTILRI